MLKIHVKDFYCCSVKVLKHNFLPVSMRLFVYFCACVYLRLSFSREGTVRRYNVRSIFITLWNWLSQGRVKNLWNKNEKRSDEMKRNADEKSLLCIHFILLCYILD